MSKHFFFIATILINCYDNYKKGLDKMENKKKKYTIISLSIIGLILLVIGISYALWIITKEQTGENVVNSACLSIDIESESDDISLLKTYPILDSEGEKLKPYKFSVHNKCSDIATYQINLESLSKVLEANRLNPNYLKVKLNEVGQEGIEKVLGETSPTDTTIANTYEAHKLMSGYLEANETKNFELRLWVDEKVTVENADSMNKEFKSKITVTSTYLEEDDVPPTSSLALSVCDDTITATATATPYKNKSISKYEYQIDEEEWQDGSETKEFTDQSIGNHTIKLRVTDNLGATSEVEQTINIVETTSAVLLGKEIQLVTSGNGLYKVSHCGISGTTNDYGFNHEEYRYAGVNYTDAQTPYVHNYVKFNNEIWRIIGLVNVKTSSGVEQRVKIVRTDGVNNQKAYGNYAWDRPSGYTNNWTTSKLKDMLNGIYYENSTGECYTGNNGSTALENTCDFNAGTELPKGLNDTARRMIDKEVIWNIGGSSTHNNVTVKQFYERERGTSTGSSNTYPAEWSSTTDVGEKYNGIGLIYPSDYGYATNGGNIGRETCFAKELYYWDNINENINYKSECGATDWLKPNSGNLWTLSPYSSDPYSAFYVGSSGYVNGYFAINASGVWPTTYLTKNVTIKSGEGTYSEPYELQLNA